MAVYTHLTTEELAELVAHYAVGALRSAKGIAEGVSNSNWLIETAGGRFILTIYETRTDREGLPFFLGLLDHLAEKGGPVPRVIHDRDGAAFRRIHDKPAALIEYLPGVAPDRPDPSQAHAVGAALARLHRDAVDFDLTRRNTMDLPEWRRLLAGCGTDGLDRIDPALSALVEPELAALERDWPSGLPRGIIHADLFPDNVLMLGDEVTGMIDFYFACEDLLAYDFAITHAAWAFDRDGGFRPEIAAALAQGYQSQREFARAEKNALPMLGRGAALRFVATRAWDWLHTPADAVVTRKDPMDFARRLAFYRDAGEEAFAL